MFVSTIGQLFSRGPTYNPATIALLARMDATGESRPVAFDGHLNTLIDGLIADGNYNTQLDVLVNTRGGIGIGGATSKLNLIKDAYNALGVNNPTYVAGLGYNGDAVSSYLRTQFIPAAGGSLYSLNSACFGMKEAGTVDLPAHGTNETPGGFAVSFTFASECINCAPPSWYLGSGGSGIDFYCVSRDSATTYKWLKGALKYDVTKNVAGLPGGGDLCVSEKELWRKFYLLYFNRKKSIIFYRGISYTSKISEITITF